MAEHDQSSKTEEPTAKRLADAFAEGQFAQSPDVGIAFGLAAAFCIIVFAMPGVAARVVGVSQSVFGHLEEYDVTPVAFSRGVMEGVALLGELLAPIAGGALVAGVLASGLQSGFRVTPKVLGFKWNRLSPASGIKRIISARVLVTFGIDFLKLSALTGILYAAVRKLMRDPIFYTPVDITHVGEFLADSTVYVLTRLLVACTAVAIISYAYQWRKTRKELMMTREEVKQERKNAEVDPQIKNAQRALARRLLQKQMLEAVPTADVVVTNPTHFAVALKYERGRDRAPVVLAKGRDVFARRIKALAAQHEVPMVENKPVARALYKYGQVGKEIPVQLYQAVAEILGFVYRTHKYYFHRLKARRMGINV